MKNIVLVFTFMAILTGVNFTPSWASEPVFLSLRDAHECDDGDRPTETFLQCRESSERKYQIYYDNAERKGLSLILKLKNGKQKIFKDEGKILDGDMCGYRLATFLPDAGFFVIDQKCGEDHTYRLVSELDGKTYATGTEYPHYTKDADKIFMMDADRKLKRPLFQVWSLKSEGVLKWDAKMELNNMVDGSWQNSLYSYLADNNTINISDVPLSRDKNDVIAIATLKNGKWIVKNNDIVLTERRKMLGAGSNNLQGSKEITGIAKVGHIATMMIDMEDKFGETLFFFERVPKFENPILDNCNPKCKVHVIVDDSDMLEKIISIEPVE